MASKRSTTTAAPMTDVRERSRSLIMNTLATSESSMVDPKELAERIEAEIFAANHESTGNNYRSSVRSHFLNLKDEKTSLKHNLLNAELSPEEFAKMTGKEMASPERQKKDQELLKHELEQTIAKPLLPDTIQQMKDGRTRAKWGVEGSFAAVD